MNGRTTDHLLTEYYNTTHEKILSSHGCRLSHSLLIKAVDDIGIFLDHLAPLELESRGQLTTCHGGRACHSLTALVRHDDQIKPNLGHRPGITTSTLPTFLGEVQGKDGILLNPLGLRGGPGISTLEAIVQVLLPQSVIHHLLYRLSVATQ